MNSITSPESGVHIPGHLPKAIPPRWRQYLYRRGFSDSTIAHFNIQPDANGWLYPIHPTSRVRRWKAFPSRHSGPKYLWKPSKADAPDTFYDPLGTLPDRIAAANGVLILATGEPDVWALHEGGITNAAATLHGEGTIPPWLLDELRRLAVSTVQLWPDRDPTGLQHAAKLRDALLGSGIRLEVFALPYAADSKGDINRLLLDVGPNGLRAALEACPPLKLPRPAPLPHRERVPRLPAQEPNSLYERWCQEVETVAVATWGIAPPNAKQLSRRNFSSPLRDDRRPSAQWSYSAHGFKDYGTGEFYSTHQVAELLGMPAWADYKSAQAPVASHPAVIPHQRHFAGGVPLTLISLLLNLHGDTWLNVKRGGLPNAGAAAVTYYVWMELVRGGVLREDEPVTAVGLHKLTQESYQLSKTAAARGLALLAEWALIQFQSLNDDDEGLGSESGLMSVEKAGRKGLRYVLRPLAEAIPAFLARLEPYLMATVLIREFPDLPVEAGLLADALTAYGLEPESLATIDAHCADLFAQHAPERAAAQREFERRRAIFRLKYGLSGLLDAPVLRLPTGKPVPNAAKFRDAVDDWLMEQGGGVRMDRYAAARTVGRSMAAHRVSCEERDIVAIPRFEEFSLEAGAGDPVDRLEALAPRAFERGSMELLAPDGASIWVSARHAETFDYGAWMDRHAGKLPVTVRVRRTSIEKRRDKATPEELAAHAQMSSQQQAVSRRRSRSSVEPKKVVALPVTWPDAYLLHQARLRAERFGLKELSDGCYVTLVGEVVQREPAALWHAIAESAGPPLKSDF